LQVSIDRHYSENLFNLIKFRLDLERSLVDVLQRGIPIESVQFSVKLLSLDVVFKFDYESLQGILVSLLALFVLQPACVVLDRFDVVLDFGEAAFQRVHFALGLVAVGKVFVFDAVKVLQHCLHDIFFRHVVA